LMAAMIASGLEFTFGILMTRGNIYGSESFHRDKR
jgi:hypothetical protein